MDASNDKKASSTVTGTNREFRRGVVGNSGAYEGEKIGTSNVPADGKIKFDDYVANQKWA